MGDEEDTLSDTALGLMGGVAGGSLGVLGPLSARTTDREGPSSGDRIDAIDLESKS